MKITIFVLVSTLSRDIVYKSFSKAEASREQSSIKSPTELLSFDVNVDVVQQLKLVIDI